MQRPRIRSIEKRDIDGIMRLEEQCFGSERWSREDFLYRLGKRELPVLIADIGGEVAGYAAATVIYDGDAPCELFVDSVAVDISLRRRGIARALLCALLDGCRESYLEVRAGNLPAIELYRSLGFYPVGIRKEYYTTPVEDAVLMTRAVDGKKAPEGTGGIKD